MKSIAKFLKSLLRQNQDMPLVRQNVNFVKKSEEHYKKPIVKKAAPVIYSDLAAKDKLLQETKSFVASIVESADDAIIGETLEGTITSWNKGAEHLFGYKGEEAIGRSISTIYPPELRDELPKMLERLKRGEYITHHQTVRMDKNSKRIPVSLSLSPIKDAKGNVVGVSAIARDISKEKELDRLKDEFISLTSHALRTPLSAIKGLISMIYQGDYGPMNDNLRKPLSNISISTERLIQLVNDLLNISRVQTGKLEFVLSAFNINDPIQKVISQLDPLAKETGIDLKFVAKPHAKVQADVEKTIDILNNLISNALKFTNKGSIEIMVEERDDMVVVMVKDTGIGIADKDKDRLFQKFQQIANPTSKQISGTGLGLYLSKTLANKMGGDVWLVESELKKGSNFAFSLPKSGSKRALEAKQSLLIEINNF